jgi:hypothetical protein
MPRAAGSFRVSDMAEDPYKQLADGAKLTRASGAQEFSGDIEGRGTVQWLMSYRPDGTAHFLGIWHVTGSLDGREGSFAIESIGEFDGERSRGTWSIVDGLGGGDLGGLRGSGSFTAPGGADATYELDYELA